jgi:hypothetical protein
MKYIDRCYAATIHKGHMPLHIWLQKTADLYDDGKIDYACVALEKSKTGKVHLQPFLVFNESAWTKKEGNKTKTFKPTDLYGESSGDYRKARSLSGARDYAARRGIHIDKPGLLRTFEFGDWVDPAYNSSLRTRLSYEFGHRIACGETPTDIALENPMGLLVVGQKALEDLKGLRGGSASANKRKRPYYYIGRSELDNYLNLADHVWFLDEEE